MAGSVASYGCPWRGIAANSMSARVQHRVATVRRMFRRAPRVSRSMAIPVKTASPSSSSSTKRVGTRMKLSTGHL